MSKSKKSKQKNPKADKTKNIAAVVLLLGGGGFVAYDYGLIPLGGDSKSVNSSSSRSVANPRTNTAVQDSLPPGAEFIQSTDPNKPSRIVTKAPPPQRVASSKDIKDIVTDYVDASKDKQAAIDSLNYTMILPSVNKQFTVQEKNTAIAKMRYEEMEWLQKIAELEASDKDGFDTGNNSNTRVVDAIDEYSSKIENNVVDEAVDDEYEGPKSTDFILDGITRADGDLIAHLRVGDRSMRVKDKSVIFGRYEVRLKSVDEVALCFEENCVSVY